MGQQNSIDRHELPAESINVCLPQSLVNAFAFPAKIPNGLLIRFIKNDQ